jgi:hypothetical protein
MGYGGCAEDDDAWYERAIVETELQDDEGLHAIRAVTEPPDDLDLHVVDPLVLQPASLPCQAAAPTGLRHCSPRTREVKPLREGPT